MTRFHMLPGVERDLQRDSGVAQQLRSVAEGIAPRVAAPAGMSVSTIAGVGPRGAFAQVIMTGPRAVIIEFGGRFTAPAAPLRRALGTVR
jgi:hypothetical protein